MSLRRSALKRTTGLKRPNPMPRTSRKRLDAAQNATQERRKPPNRTGPSPKVRAVVLDRADGCCELCGLRLHDSYQWLQWAHSYHHRRPRGAGGTRRPDTNSPANLLLVCGTGTTGCHGAIETNRAEARIRGWLVGQHQDPADIPLELFIYPGELMILNHDGTYEPAP